VAPPGRFAYISPTNSPEPEETAMRGSIMIVCLVCLFAGTSGVSLAADSAELAAQRSRLELASVPAEPAGVLAVIQQLKAQPAHPGKPPTREVTVTGQIGGMPNPWHDTHPDFPWFAGQASLFLLDNKIAAQFASHARSHGGHHNCAFCQRLAAKQAHTVAVVNFVDEEGQILKIDARELLGLIENQRIIVRGRAEFLGGTMLVIHADGVHIRR
jgi:hypothetical protein